MKSFISFLLVIGLSIYGIYKYFNPTAIFNVGDCFASDDGLTPRKDEIYQVSEVGNKNYRYRWLNDLYQFQDGRSYKYLFMDTSIGLVQRLYSKVECPEWFVGKPNESVVTELD